MLRPSSRIRLQPSPIRDAARALAAIAQGWPTPVCPVRTPGSAGATLRCPVLPAIPTSPSGLRARGRRAAGPVLLHIHGGAFVIGNPSRTTSPVSDWLSRRLPIVSVDYRLAPSTRTPHRSTTASPSTVADRRCQRARRGRRAVIVTGVSAGGASLPPSRSGPRRGRCAADLSGAALPVLDDRMTTPSMPR